MEFNKEHHQLLENSKKSLQREIEMLKQNNLKTSALNDKQSMTVEKLTQELLDAKAELARTEVSVPVEFKNTSSSILKIYLLLFLFSLSIL